PRASAPLLLGERQRVLCENPLLDRLALDEVLLDEQGDVLRRHAVIPRPFGVDHHRRAVAADAQTADLGAIASVFARPEALLLDLALEHLPRRRARLWRATVRARAEK